MLKRSLRSAFVLSAMGVLAFAVTTELLNLLAERAFPHRQPAPSPNPELLNSTTNLVVVGAILLIALAILITLGAYWLYRFFGEAYFGRRGAARWALFGALFALLLKLPAWLVSPDWWLLKDLLQFAGVFVAFFAARVVVPLRR